MLYGIPTTVCVTQTIRLTYFFNFLLFKEACVPYGINIATPFVYLFVHKSIHFSRCASQTIRLTYS